MKRREYLTATGAVVATTLAGCTDDGGYPTDPEPPSGAVANAPIPSNTDQYNYAVMGKSSSNPTIEYFGNWKCPFCARFSEGLLQDITESYVKTDKLNVKFRGLVFFDGEPFLGVDAPDAARAGLSVWENKPSKYWEFHDYVFRNQPPERIAWANEKNMRNFMDGVGLSESVKSKTIKAMRNNSYTDRLEKTTTKAGNFAINSTPVLLIGDRTYKPLNQRDKVISAIEERI